MDAWECVSCRQQGLVCTHQFASGGVLPTLPAGSSYSGLLVELEPCGYRLTRDAAESLGRSGEVVRALNDAGVSFDGVDAVHEAIAREMSRRAEAMARAWFSERMVGALNQRVDALSIDHNGDVFDALHGECGGVILSAGQLSDLVDLFTSLLANPPAMVTDADGVTRIEQR